VRRPVRGPAARLELVGDVREMLVDRVAGVALASDGKVPLFDLLAVERQRWLRRFRRRPEPIA